MSTMTSGYEVRAESFAEVEQEWWDLLGRCDEANTVFVTPVWQQPWADGVLDGEGYMPLAIRLDGELVGLCPVRRFGDRVSFAADQNLCDYLDFVVDRAHEEAAFNALLDHLEAEGWKTIDLVGLQDGSPTLTALPAVAKARGYTVDIEEFDVAPYADLPSTWEEYQSSMRRKDRHELRRKMRRLEQAGDLSYRIVGEDDQDIEGGLEEFFRLMRMSREDKAQFLTEEREGFFRHLATNMANRGYLRLFMMDLDEKTVSACLGFNYGGRFFLYNSGFDTDYSALSVGLLVKAHSIEHSIQEGKAVYDFLRTNETYKYHLGAQDRQVFRCVIRRGEEE